MWNASTLENEHTLRCNSDVRELLVHENILFSGCGAGNIQVLCCIWEREQRNMLIDGDRYGTWTRSVVYKQPRSIQMMCSLFRWAMEGNNHLWAASKGMWFLKCWQLLIAVCVLIDVDVLDCSAGLVIPLYACGECAWRPMSLNQRADPYGMCYTI